MIYSIAVKICVRFLITKLTNSIDIYWFKTSNITSLWPYYGLTEAAFQDPEKWGRVIIDRPALLFWTRGHFIWNMILFTISPGLGWASLRYTPCSKAYCLSTHRFDSKNVWQTAFEMKARGMLLVPRALLKIAWSKSLDLQIPDSVSFQLTNKSCSHVFPPNLPVLLDVQPVNAHYLPFLDQ